MKNQQKNNGFTLIELMVATALFVVIMVTALSSLFMLLDESKNSRALRFAMDNVNFAMESMSRSIRMGTEYSQTAGNLNISFTPQDGNSSSRVTYALSSADFGIHNTVGKTVGNGKLVPIVSSDVNIKTLKFILFNSTQTQPSVYIIMKGTVMVKGVETSFAVQTMASQRNY